MNVIIARWEWRTFGLHFGVAEDRIEAMGTNSLQHSEEIYLLSANNGTNAKIRDGLLDVKRLEKTNNQGFEQWRPVLKTSLPLTPADIETVLSALNIPPCLESAAYSLDELIATLTHFAGFSAVPVHKSRARYRFAGCSAELTEVSFGTQSIRTLAVESEDPGNVTAALQSLGLDGLENVNYPKGLKSWLGLQK